MRIGFDAKRAFANKTGLGNYSRFILNALTRHEQQHEYLAFTPTNKHNLFPEFPQNATRYPEGFLNKKLKSWWRYSRISEQLQTEKIDLFHGLSNEIPQGLKAKNIASVVTIHDLIFERLPHLFKSVDRMLYRHKFKSSCERADVIIAISEQTKRDIVSIYNIAPAKIEVVYQDSSPLFHKRIPEDARLSVLGQYQIEKPYILCVGTLEERKNQHRLVEAFAGLEKDFDLVLIGKPTPYLSRMKESISRFSLEKSVRILHNVPSAHLPALYQQAEIFAYPSIYEGFGIPVVEALHSGTPVVSAKGSCLEEAGGPGGLYADPFNAEDIGVQLRKLATDVSLRNSLSDLGKNYIARFDEKQIARQLVSIYERIKS